MEQGMAQGGPLPRGLSVPSGRISRLARFGGLASGIAGNMVVNGARELAAGRRPALGELLLTPANITRLTDELARMRGAAMKVGQLLSMDTGDMLPPELTAILARLRAEAHPMPPQQLKATLTAAWGADWLRRFARFDVRPIAAASIGQVHRAQTRDGRDLAIKVQYPGVRRSIDSDVDNVATLIRLSGLVPAAIDLAPMLAEAKRQLHEEADYAWEGEQLARFGALLADDPDYLVPAPHADLTTTGVLAMGHVGGVAVEALADAPQAERDHAMTLAIRLLFRELFEFHLMQTDPNFANYRYDLATRRLILLDFGATRAFPSGLVEDYRRLMRAALRDDRAAMREAAIAIGFFDAGTQARHAGQVVEMMAMAMAPLRGSGPFDFGDAAFMTRMREAGMALGAEKDFWHVPPMDALYLQRKFGGTYLLGARLRARVDVRALLEPHLAPS
jgi:predicted unusual protein kinase regulating ubiquinone biosynthesis (AarF/ABC1/UbiB family)